MMQRISLKCSIEESLCLWRILALEKDGYLGTIVATAGPVTFCVKLDDHRYHQDQLRHRAVDETPEISSVGSDDSVPITLPTQSTSDWFSKCHWIITTECTVRYTTDLKMSTVTAYSTSTLWPNLDKLDWYLHFSVFCHFVTHCCLFFCMLNVCYGHSFMISMVILYA